MTDKLIKGDFLTVENEKIITTAKCPICGEMATVYKFGKGQGRISHHGHSVCFSSREVRAMIEPEREPDRVPEREPAAAPVDPAETKIIEPEREPEGAHQVAPGPGNREPEGAHQVAPGTGNREPEGETLTFGVF